ncbi:MAG: hypothetical protein WD826_09745 [Actinomycetota bacterium]
MAARSRLPLPLDHNFPQPILDVLDEYLVEVELTPIRRIDSRLPALEDRDLFVALHQLGFPGLITANYKMLKNPRELAALMSTKLTVFAIEGVGHDPLRATGALLLDLPGALKRFERDKAQVFWLRPRQPQPTDPWDLFTKAAGQIGEERQALFDRLRVPPDELANPILT